MSRSHKIGDRIALDDIVPGDTIRFETKYTRPQEDTVELIVPMDSGLRRRVFCDTRKHAINSLPDTVTDAFVVSLTGDWTPGVDEKAEAEAIKDIQDKFAELFAEAETRFIGFKKGTVLSKQEGGRQHTYVKYGKDKWVWTETFMRGNDTFVTDSETLDTNDALYELYDYDAGELRGVTVFEP